MRFKMLDKDGKGTLGFKEIKAMMQSIEGEEGISDEGVQGMIDEVDRDRKGAINLQEFLNKMDQ